MAVEYLAKGNDDGTCLGYDTSEKISFWGTTPCDQPAALTSAVTTVTVSAAATANYTTTFAIVTTTTGYAFTDANIALSFGTAVANLQTRVAEIEAALEEIGIVASN